MTHTCQHVAYRMSCREYDALRERARHACELCGTTAGPLDIDHDHKIGYHAPRGLLCRKCNSGLRPVDKGQRSPSDSEEPFLPVSDDSTAAYAQLFMVAFMAAVAWTYVWWAALIPVALFATLVWAFNR